jgi:hypothetical protein
MLSFPETNEHLEVQCIIMTRGKVGEDENDNNSQIIPQFAVATRVDGTVAPSPFLACSHLDAEVVIHEEDVYAVPSPFIVTPQEQSGIVANIHAVLVDEDDLVIDGDAVLIEDETPKKSRSLLGLLKTKSNRLSKIRLR